MNTMKMQVEMQTEPPAIKPLAQAVVKLWNACNHVNDWTTVDDIINAYIVALIGSGVHHYGHQDFGWALIDAGLSAGDAEDAVDRPIHPRPDVYAENADVWQES